VIGFSEIMAGLETNEKFCRDSESGFKAQGKGGAYPFSLAYHVTKQSSADLHGGSCGGLGNAVMLQGVADEGGGGI